MWDSGSGVVEVFWSVFVDDVAFKFEFAWFVECFCMHADVDSENLNYDILFVVVNIVQTNADILQSTNQQINETVTREKRFCKSAVYLHLPTPRASQTSR